MKGKAVLGIVVLVVFFMLLQGSDAMAQGCSQCRMVPQTSLEGGASDAKGLNNGILYLLVIPYLLLMGILYFFFRAKIHARWEQLKLRFLGER